MCDPITAIIGAITAGSSLLGATKKAPKPPSLPAPAIDPASAQTDVADVRANTDETTESNTPEYVGFAPKRIAGNTVGGLGRSGLAL